MKEIRFRGWHLKEKRMYARAYQKWFHVLLCEDDGGRSVPVRRAFYGDCVLLESTGLYDRHNREVFEGDIVRVDDGQRGFVDVVGSVPDSFGSSSKHPLGELLAKHALSDASKRLSIEVLGNEYEHEHLLAARTR